MKLTRIATLAIGSSVALATIGVSSAKATLLVTPENDATTLGNAILGAGVTGTNFVYTGAASAAGTFTGGVSAGIGIESGILLTSGSSALAVGPNNSDSTGANNGTTGDAQLSGLAAGATTYDANILSFDFTSTSSNLFFNFVFASEEYNEFVGSTFNDVFGFFLDGNNIALIPDTTTPVTINNVNLTSNPGYYVNNSPGSADIQYDGFTTVLTASATGLSAGSHTIKLAIADVGDSGYDSAVFLQANSFVNTIPTTAVPEPFTIVGTLVGGTAALRIRKKLKSGI
jgi:hypothetical protein